MKVLICGSRSFLERKPIFDWIEKSLGSSDLVIHGACPVGADAIADEACKSFCIPVQRYPANWSLGRHAGMLRNQTMIEQWPGLVVAFWNGCSSGTQNTLELAAKRGIHRLIIPQAGCQEYVSAKLHVIERQGRLF